MAEQQIPLPINGLNTVNPFLPLESGYARELTNYSLYAGKLIMRPGIDLSESNPVNPGNQLGWINNSGGFWYSIDLLAPGNIRKVEDNTGATNIGGSFQANATTCKHISLDLLIGAKLPRNKDYPFTAWTFTTLGITANTITSACSYKGRLYVCNGQTLEYSSVAAITGTMAGSFTLTEFLDGQSVSRIFSITTQPGNDVDNVFVIFGDGGKVLVYSGDYPGSTTWNLAANYDMPKPISNQGFVNIDGDLFIATTRYCYWFRDLFQSGSSGAYENSPTKPIENIWQVQTWDGALTLSEHAHIWYHEKYDAIVCQCSQIQLGSYPVFDYQNEAMCFVYFRKYNAWTIWAAAPFFAPIIKDTNSDLYYGIGYGSSVTGLLPDTTRDQREDLSTQYIVTSWKTPYIRAINGKVQKVTGVRPYFGINTDYSFLSEGLFRKIQVIYDYSDLYFRPAFSMYYQIETGVTDIPPGNYSSSTYNTLQTIAGNQFSPLVNVGGEGVGYSIQFTQEYPSNLGYENCIYGATVYVETGGTQS